MKRQFPVITATLLVLATLAQLTPGFSELLVYDRVKILQGELWRLLGCHLVHFTPAHYGSDALALAVLGTLVERSGTFLLTLLVLSLALVIGVGLLALEPEIAVFGGLSGITYGLGAYLALGGVFGAWRQRAFWTAMLILLFGKIGLDLYQHVATPGLPPHTAFVPVPLSHGLGVAAASLVFFGVGRGHVYSQSSPQGGNDELRGNDEGRSYFFLT